MNTWNIWTLKVTHRMRASLARCFMDGISCLCHSKLEPVPSDLRGSSATTDLIPHLWQAYVCHPPPSILPVDSMLPHSESRSLPPVFAPVSGPPPPTCPPWMLLQDQKKNYKAVQSSEEGGSGGAYLEPLVALAQNGTNMHNVLGPACIFLRKGFAESRQAVRKSRPYHAHACQEISTCTTLMYQILKIQM